MDENDCKELLGKKLNILGMMMTSYSILRDRNDFWAKVIDCIVVFFSVIIAATVFFDASILKTMNINGEIARIIIGSLSLMITALSLISMRLDLKGKMFNYDYAFRQIDSLKTEGEKINYFEKEDIVQKTKEFLDKYSLAQLNIAKIPDNDFLRLKAIHKSKVELSKLIDKNQGVPFIVLNTIFFFRKLVSKKSLE